MNLQLEKGYDDDSGDVGGVRLIVREAARAGKAYFEDRCATQVEGLEVHLDECQSGQGMENTLGKRDKMASSYSLCRYVDLNASQEFEYQRNKRLAFRYCHCAEPMTMRRALQPNSAFPFRQLSCHLDCGFHR